MSAHAQMILDIFGPLYPSTYGVVKLIAEYQRAHEKVTGFDRPIINMQTRNLHNWRFYKTFIVLEQFLTRHNVEHAYEFFVGPLTWWKNKQEEEGKRKCRPRRKPMMPPSMLLAEWAVDMYEAKALDRRGSVRVRDDELMQRVAISNSVSILRPLLEQGIPYEIALVRSMALLSPEFLATDQTYLGLVKEEILHASPEVSREWDRMKTDSTYRAELLRIREYATSKIR